MSELHETAVQIAIEHAKRLQNDPNLAMQLDKRMELLPIFVPIHISLVTLAKALMSHGFELHATERGEIEVRNAPLSREQALEMNRKNIGDTMRFTPADGLCWSCGADVVGQYGTHAIAAGLNVTGCRKCHRSFCE